MASSWKAAETGIVRVPRSHNGSVRAARPLATSPWATPNLCALFDRCALIQINGQVFPTWVGVSMRQRSGIPPKHDSRIDLLIF